MSFEVKTRYLFDCGLQSACVRRGSRDPETECEENLIETAGRRVIRQINAIKHLKKIKHFQN